MAKVMISLPDELLTRLDERAREQGATRSGLLRSLVERDLLEGDAAVSRALQQLLDSAEPQDGRAVEWIREDRRRSGEAWSWRHSISRSTRSPT